MAGMPFSHLDQLRQTAFKFQLSTLTPQIRFQDPNESKRVIEAIVACLDNVQTTKPREEKTG
jgi:hypothetical protein